MRETLRKKSDVARYLGKDAAEVDRLLADDGLPHVRLPGATRPTVRFRLRDVYEWLMRYNRGCSMSYEDFRREFDGAGGNMEKLD